MKKPHAHLQSYIKTCEKFQKDQPKTVRLPYFAVYRSHLCIRRTYKMYRKSGGKSLVSCISRINFKVHLLIAWILTFSDVKRTKKIGHIGQPF